MTERLSGVVPGFVVGRKSYGRCIYSREGKRALVEECLRPGVSVARLALIHEVNANLLRKWIKLHEASAMRTPSKSPELLPVIAVDAVPAPKPRLPPESPIEIVIGNATIRLHGAVDAQRARPIHLAAGDIGSRAQTAQLHVTVRHHQAQIDKLKLQLARLKRLQFGRSSEKLDQQIEQLELLIEELETPSLISSASITTPKPDPSTPRQ